MRIDIISILPEFFNNIFYNKIYDRAAERKLIEVNIHNLRQYTVGKNQQVDDYPFGGESGMILKLEPIYKCILDLKKERKYDKVIYLSPDGKLLNQRKANKISLLNNIIILCGHYKGVDQRVRDNLIDEEISIGKYVISSGELAACVLLDSVVRLIPGFTNSGDSVLSDTFQDGVISYPVYTRPRSYNGWEVPDVLLSGNEKEINDWKDKKSKKS